MTRLSVSPTRDYLLRDGRPFYYLGDTAWMAFANLPLEDWPRYLRERRRQGFNALQISILPITHDTSMDPSNLDPFLQGADGDWDFAQLNPAYFDKAEAMVKMAVEQDFVPVLGVLWCSYVPETRCAKNSPVASAMPLEAVAPYARYVAERFKPYEPVYFISGDTQFEAPDEEAYYMTALEAVQAADPEALLTMHLTPRGDLPQTFVERIDFYMYQSGHHSEHQHRPYTLAEKFRSYPIKRPVLNSEPPYEGHGRVGTRTRFDAFDIRKATWQSLLAGAKMGVCYGGHGVWMFHRRGMRFLATHRSFEPYDWDEAMRLDGAWDMGFARWLFETYAMFDLEPADLVSHDDPEIRAAVNADQTKVAVYTPYSFDLELKLDLTGFHCLQIDLRSRQVMTPTVDAGATSRIAMPQVNADALFLATKT